MRDRTGRRIALDHGTPNARASFSISTSSLDQRTNAHASVPVRTLGRDAGCRRVPNVRDATQALPDQFGTDTALHHGLEIVPTLRCQTELSGDCRGNLAICRHVELPKPLIYQNPLLELLHNCMTSPEIFRRWVRNILFTTESLWLAVVKHKVLPLPCDSIHTTFPTEFCDSCDDRAIGLMLSAGIGTVDGINGNVFSTTLEFTRTVVLSGTCVMRTLSASIFSKISLLLLLSGCSSHPLPDEVTRTSTFHLVQRLRCEARQGLDDVIRALDKDSKKKEAFKAAMQNTFIGFDFKFDITESNKASSGTLEFLNSFTGGGKFSLALSGGLEKTRQNERYFRLVELFSELAEDKNVCTDIASDHQHKNMIYPIAGKVGLDEVVKTYTLLKDATTFKPTEKESTTVFSDTLTFTTTVKAGIKPSIELNTIAGQFRLKNASIDGGIERKDIHKVVVAIAAKSKDKKEDAPGLNVFVTGRLSSTYAAPSPAAGVLRELDRLRNRDDDVRAFESLRLPQ